MVGETISVECSVSGYPAPSVSWQRNGCTIIPQPDRYQVYYDGECSTLKFVSVSMADAGTYICMAENTIGKANTQVSISCELYYMNSRIMLLYNILDAFCNLSEV